ncbi:SOS response-associated peptidase [Ochrobactrum sp. SFR4]|uniref:SOS response-associated peptidase n=1 Tax=Ochrobactrum sp. SFR4 TaxID=2717368 RepID=UPI001C8BF4BA|nr:SOS response-associated peptidase [Ochrobactrum sp. SFR4]MBX8824635.1 SOS response-associated peptidase [Ochrobactrum sp. SFR4]
MCGRFALLAAIDEVEAHFGVIVDEAFPPRYNISPTQPIMIVMAGETPVPGSNRPDRIAMLVRWGFVPSWTKDPLNFPLMINARSETAHEKPSFRTAMEHRRSLLPVTGFYEWRKLGDGRKQAYWIRPRHGGTIAFGALMETWVSGDGSQMDTAAILTTASNNALSYIHDRLPLVIQPEDYLEWLDCKRNRAKDVQHLLRPVQDDFFEAIPVSDKINNARYFGTDVHEPVEELTVSQEPIVKKPAKPKKSAVKKKTDDNDDQFSMF